MIATQASFPPEQRTILVGALELTDRHLREVLIPRRDVVALPANFSVTEAIRELVASTDVRAPVFRGDLDDVIGSPTWSTWSRPPTGSPTTAGRRSHCQSRWGCWRHCAACSGNASS
jgi:hypothetical protein